MDVFGFQRVPYIKHSCIKDGVFIVTVVKTSNLTFVYKPASFTIDDKSVCGVSKGY
jgi:hypothetical protein